MMVVVRRNLYQTIYVSVLRVRILFCNTKLVEAGEDGLMDEGSIPSTYTIFVYYIKTK
jgi:hypothetical protein